ncbi:MAG: FtsW/RodA/SpoVE family cell cycle protein [Erysipelotrichaceae bacterium]
MKKQKIKFGFRLPSKYDLWLHLAILGLLVFGTIMITSASMGSSANPNGASVIYTTLIKQLIFVFVSYYSMIFLSNNFSLQRARNLGKPVGIIILGLLIATLFFDDNGTGARSWIRLGSLVSIQPSEFVKIYMVIMMAVSIGIAGRRNFDFWTIIKTPFIYLVLFSVVILLQPDFGTLIIILMICGICFLIPSHLNLRKYQKKALIAIGVLSVILLFAMTPQGIKFLEKAPLFGYQIKRFESSLNPLSDPYGTSYQLMNGLYAIALGGFFGVGLGNSVQKFGFLTQASSDYILAIVIEELGLFGLMVVLIGYIIMIQRLLHYAYLTKNESYKIILVGTSMYIFIHFVINVGGISGLIPLTGVPLLFISSGGSALLSIMIAMGISQAVISKIRHQQDT